jgi:sec-independent protein translocase protein TatB
MFEVGFSELVVIFGISLMVLGPTRLPGLVRKIGRWIGKARSMARQFREQLENEVNLDELNKMTDLRAKEAKAQAPSTPAPPPELSGEPPREASASTYPYAASDSTADTATNTTDDSYSHAHAAGDAPMPCTPEAAEIAPEAPDSTAVESPAVAMADAATPEASTPSATDLPLPDGQQRA